MTELAKLYDARFKAIGLNKRTRVWKVLCSAYFQRLVPSDAVVLDLACGYGEFINNINAGIKLAIDLNPDAPLHLNSDVTFHLTGATDIQGIAGGSVDLVFTSNFLEHLRSKEECDLVFTQVKEVLKPGGLFVVLGPNIKFAYAEYWDYYDHYLPLSHLSLAEGLDIAGFEVERLIPRFLPYTMKNKTPAHPLLVRAYLAFPIAWKILGKQFLVIARKPYLK